MKHLNNEDKLQKQFLQQFSEDAAQPRGEFEQKLKAQVLNTKAKRGDAFTQQNGRLHVSKLSTIFSMKRQKALFSGITVMMVVLLVSGTYLLPTIQHKRRVQEAQSNIEKLKEKALQANSTKALAANKTISANASSLARGESTATNSYMNAKVMQTPSTPPSQESMPMDQFLASQTSSESGAIKEYNFSHNEMRFIPGPAAAKCDVFDQSEMPDKIVNYDFWGNDEYPMLYASKMVTYRDGEIDSYILSRETSDLAETYEYRGGKYAVHLIRKLEEPVLLRDEQKASESTDSNSNETELVDASSDTNLQELQAPQEFNETGSNDTETSETLIAPQDSDYDDGATELKPTEDTQVTEVPTPYLDDAEIVDIVEIDGQDYYVMEWKEKLPCSTDMTTGETDKSQPFEIMVNPDMSSWETVITRSYFNTEDMKILKEEEYLNDVSDDNLLMTTYTDVDVTDWSDWSDVKDFFEFDLNVPIKEIEMPDWSEQDMMPSDEAKIEFLKEHNYTLLKPVVKEGELSVSMVEIPVLYEKLRDVDETKDDPFSYMYDRDFYPDTPEGQKTYEMMVGIFDSTDQAEPSPVPVEPQEDVFAMSAPDVIVEYTVSEIDAADSSCVSDGRSGEICNDGVYSDKATISVEYMHDQLVADKMVDLYTGIAEFGQNIDPDDAISIDTGYVTVDGNQVKATIISEDAPAYEDLPDYPADPDRRDSEDADRYMEKFSQYSNQWQLTTYIFEYKGDTYVIDVNEVVDRNKNTGVFEAPVFESFDAVPTLAEINAF